MEVSELKKLSAKGRLAVSFSALVLCFVFLLWQNFLAIENEYRLEGERLSATRQELLSRWEVVKGARSNGETVLLSGNEDTILATFAFDRLYSLEGSTLSCTSGTISVGDSSGVVHSVLDVPERTRKISENGKEEVFLHRGFLGVPLLCIVVTYKDGLVTMVTLVSVFRIPAMFLQTLLE